MFRFTMKPSSGSHSQFLAKIIHSVQCAYLEVVQTLSVLWLHSMTCEACVLWFPDDGFIVNRNMLE
jgi:Ni,Fe-hydrogenase I small subunit